MVLLSAAVLFGVLCAEVECAPLPCMCLCAVLRFWVGGYQFFAVVVGKLFLLLNKQTRKTGKGPAPSRCSHGKRDPFVTPPPSFSHVAVLLFVMFACYYFSLSSAIWIDNQDQGRTPEELVIADTKRAFKLAGFNFKKRSPVRVVAR